MRGVRTRDPCIQAIQDREDTVTTALHFLRLTMLRVTLTDD